MSTRTWTLIVLGLAVVTFFVTGIVSLLLNTSWTFWLSVAGVGLTVYTLRLWQLTFKDKE